MSMYDDEVEEDGDSAPKRILSGSSSYVRFRSLVLLVELSGLPRRLSTIMLTMGVQGSLRVLGRIEPWVRVKVK